MSQANPIPVPVPSFNTTAPGFEATSSRSKTPTSSSEISLNLRRCQIWCMAL
ncbi:MAG: hypothetical protein ACPHDX_06830 [Flavobacteriaceae bacterium]